MKWRILLELTETTGSVQAREMVTGDRPTNVISPSPLGLSAACKNASKRDPICMLCIPLIDQANRLAGMGSRFARKITPQKFYFYEQINVLGDLAVDHDWRCFHSHVCGLFAQFA